MFPRAIPIKRAPASATPSKTPAVGARTTRHPVRSDRIHRVSVRSGTTRSAPALSRSEVA